MNTTIEVYSRSVYGEQRIYVSKKEQADAIGKITGTKTLTPIQIRGLEQLGFAFYQVVDPRIKETCPSAGRWALFNYVDERK